MPIQRAIALWPVDRSVDRAKPHGRSVGRPPAPESGVLAVGRPLGRPAQVAGQRACFVHVGRPTLGPVDWPGRPLEPGRAD